MLNPDFDRLAAEAHESESVQLQRALVRLGSTLSFLQVGAHPDDETSGLLALLRFRDGHRIGFACSTRGEGGQNSLSRHKGDDLAFIRSAEMEAAARVLDMTLYWFGDSPDAAMRDLATRDLATRDLAMPDFRFSKSAEETLAHWGRDRVLDHMVRIVRQEKPDAICPTFLDVGGQHGHHRAMTRIAREAFECAADPAAFPSHLDHGLEPWATAKFYLPAWSGAGASYDDETPPPPATTPFDIGDVDPASGAPYARIGEWSRRFHATQGMGVWLEAGTRPRPLHLAASRVSTPGTAETGLGDGLPVTLADWARERGAPADLHEAAARIEAGRSATPFSARQIALLTEAREALIRALSGCPEPLRPLLSHRLSRKIAEIEHALALASRQGLGDTPSGHGQRQPSLPPVTLAIQPDAVMVNAASQRPLAPVRIVATAHGEAMDVRLEASAPSSTPPISLPAPFRLEPGKSLAHAVAMTPGAEDGRAAVAFQLNGKPAMRVIDIAMPHLGSLRRLAPASLRVGHVEAAIAPGTRVAYLGAGHDQVDRWLDQIGIEVEAIADGGLDAARLGSFSTVLVGIFAAGARRDLAAAWPLLHAFVRSGGHLVTLYHRPGDGWLPDHVPLAPIIIGSPSLRYRVTDQNAAVTHLITGHPLLNWPNPIGPEDWAGWVKERGLYFARSWDAAYEALVSMADPGEAPQHGGLLSGRFGAGRHSHVALALHTEMDNLTPGAFRLMANLVAPALAHDPREVRR